MPLCKNPYMSGMSGNLPCPCNKCIPCMINKARLWKNRILMEAQTNDQNSFVTLTYADEHLPFINHETGETLTEPTLHPPTLTKFFKRLRRISPSIGVSRIRYYAVGEYGKVNKRPHYHLALFGFPSCERGQTKRNPKTHENIPCCKYCDLLHKAWGLGGIDNALIEPASAGYITGYVTDKLIDTVKENHNGRYSQFSRMSRKPALGVGFLDHIVKSIQSKHGEYMLTEHGDVPLSLNVGGKPFPLGRYLRDQLRKKLKLEETYDLYTGVLKYKAQQASLQAYKKELQILQNLEEGAPAPTPYHKGSVKHFIQSKDKQKIINLEKRHNLLKKEKTL